jgi:hypothetical protein
MMGFPLFTLREQAIRLIMKECHRSLEAAAEIKKKGGIPIEFLFQMMCEINTEGRAPA